MKKSRSKYASKRYSNLYKPPNATSWVFRKYSSAKREEFYFVTGEDKNEALAYKRGVEAFDRWLGVFLPSGRQIQVKDIARSVLASKEGKKHGTAGNTYRSAKNQIENHIIPAFGHLRPEQLTSLRWDQYIAEQRRMGKNRKFFNMRKLTREILKRAFEENLIPRVPELKNVDAPAKPPVYHDRQTIRKVLHAYPRAKKDGRLLKRAIPGKLLAFMVWKQGGRPGEICQYRFSMIRGLEGAKPTIRIPGEITKTNRAREIPLNSRVARVLRWYSLRVEGDCIFPSQTNVDVPMKEYKSGWNAACARAGVDATIYELRDTFITDALLRGLSSTFIGKYVDSSSEMIDKRYAVAVREAMDKVAG